MHSKATNPSHVRASKRADPCKAQPNLRVRTPDHQQIQIPRTVRACIHPFNMANPKVFFDINIGGAPAGRIVMEVRLKTRRLCCISRAVCAFELSSARPFLTLF